jgi:outer membrane protein assembly factor BamE (lipoprotein component of BamABCDE complex)
VRIRIALFIIATFAACTPTGSVLGRADLAERARTEMIGQSKEQVFACMGPPAQVAQFGGQEVWRYQSGGRTVSSGSAYQTGSPYNPVIVGGAQSEYRSCTIDLTWKNDKLANMVYRGNTGGALTAGEQCAYAVAACVGGS